MQALRSFGSRGGLQSISRIFTRWFPTPALLAPPAAGIDISDASVKWLMLTREPRAVASYGESPLPQGAVVSGVIHDHDALAHALREVKQHIGAVHCAHAALPEEAAYVFSMHVPHALSHEETLRMVEFEFEGRVPIPPSAAVYDFDVIAREKDFVEIGVAVFPRDLAESYVAAVEAAGITLLSLEIEARSIARAITAPMPDEPITLLVDFGRERTGFAVLNRGIPIFTSTVEVGGDAISRALIEKLKLSPEEAETFRNEQGLMGIEHSKNPGAEFVINAASALADEIARHYHYWDTRRNDEGERMTPVSRVVLVGGSANLKGLPDYIASRVQAQTLCGDVWRNVAAFESYIPPIDKRRSLQYATAIGLALRNV